MRKWFTGPHLDLTAFSDLVDNQSVFSYPRSPRDSVCSTPSERGDTQLLKSPLIDSPRSNVWQTSSESVNKSSSAYGSFSSEPQSPVAGEDTARFPSSRGDPHQSFTANSDHSQQNGNSGMVNTEHVAGSTEVEADKMPVRNNASWRKSSGGDGRGEQASPRYSASQDAMYDPTKLQRLPHSTTPDRSGTDGTHVEEYNNFRFSDGPSPPGTKPHSGEDYLPPTRVRERRSGSSSSNPLQFVKADGASLSQKAQETIEIMQKQKVEKEVMKTEEDDWQSVSLSVCLSVGYFQLGFVSLFGCNIV